MNTTEYRVKRALSDEEIQGVFNAIEHATNTGEVLVATMVGVFDALLRDLGERWADYGKDRKLDVTAFAIPSAQWTAIASAVASRCDQWGTGVTTSMDLVNLMPSHYEDESVTVPERPQVDRRPYVHELHVQRSAVDVIAACEARIQDLGQHYGFTSQYYQDALHSFHRQLVRLFSMSMGADTSISKDGDLSLFVRMGSGFVFGVIFHEDRRQCTDTECGAQWSESGEPWTYSSERYPIKDHEHVWSYPVGSPLPGTWSFHS